MSLCYSCENFDTDSHGINCMVLGHVFALDDDASCEFFEKEILTNEENED